MGMLNPLSIQRHNSSKGRHTAIVVDDNDKANHKDKKAIQRVKVRIPGLHRNVPDEDLPWAVKHPEGQVNGGEGQVGHVQIPQKGSEILVGFDDDDPHTPAYIGSPSTEQTLKDHEHIKHPDYPYVEGHVDRSGNKYETNTERNTITVTHTSGTVINIAGDGTVSITSAKNLSIGVNGNLSIAASGKIDIHAGGNMNLEGARIDLNKGGGSSPAGASARSRPNLPNPAGKTSL